MPGAKSHEGGVVTEKDDGITLCGLSPHLLGGGPGTEYKPHVWYQTNRETAQDTRLNTAG